MNEARPKFRMIAQEGMPGEPRFTIKLRVFFFFWTTVAKNLDVDAALEVLHALRKEFP